MALQILLGDHLHEAFCSSLVIFACVADVT